jgi:hypothetical protein
MKNTLLSCLLLATLSAFGQVKFIPGNIVLNNGDTLKGLVMDEQWFYSPTQIKFKQSETSTQTKYRVADIRSVSTSFGTYERYIIRYDPDDPRIRFLPRTRDPQQLKEDTLLLKLIYKSRYSLYHTTTRNGRPHFFLSSDTSGNGEAKIEELLFRNWMKVDNGEVLMKNEKWKQQLINLTLACGEPLRKQIKESDYNEGDLVKIVEALNLCEGGQVYRKPETTLPRKKSRFGVVASAFKYGVDLETGYSLPGDLQYAFGISYEHFSRKRPDRFGFYHELKYATVEQDGVAFNYSAPGSYSITSLKMSNMIRLYHPKNKIAFFLGGGIGSAVRTKAIGLIEKTQFTTEVVFADFSKGSFETGFLGGVGIKVNPAGLLFFSLETRYEYTVGIFEETDFLAGRALNLIAVIGF